MDAPVKNVTLSRKGDALVVRVDGGAETPARLVWVRPLSGQGQEVAVLNKEHKELATIENLDRLDPASRALAEEELVRRYLAPRIVRVLGSMMNFGSRYWDVETDRGCRRFIMKDPNKNVFWVSDDHLVLRDTVGNRYEIVSLKAMDAESRAEIDRVM